MISFLLSLVALVCGYMFYGRLVERVFGPDGVYGGVVELHSLADSDGACAQDQYLLAVAYYGLVLLLVSGIEVRHVGVVLGGAAVDELVYRINAQ